MLDGPDLGGVHGWASADVQPCLDIDPSPPALDDFVDVEAGRLGDVRQVRSRPQTRRGSSSKPTGNYRSGQRELRQDVIATGRRRWSESMVMKIEKELERVDLFGIGEPRRRFDRLSQALQAPPEVRELRDVS